MCKKLVTSSLVTLGLLCAATTSQAVEQPISAKNFCEIYVSGLMDGASSYAFLTTHISISNQILDARSSMISTTCTGINNQNMKSRLQAARESISSQALARE